MTGKTLIVARSPKYSEIINFDVHSLPTGIYFVKAFYNGKWFSEKVLVKK